MSALSRLLGCKQKIIELLPQIEMTINNIKEADSSLMQMQAKRQREIWHLLKIACVSIFAFLYYCLVNGCYKLT